MHLPRRTPKEGHRGCWGATGPRPRLSPERVRPASPRPRPPTSLSLRVSQTSAWGIDAEVAPRGSPRPRLRRPFLALPWPRGLSWRAAAPRPVCTPSEAPPPLGALTAGAVGRDGGPCPLPDPSWAQVLGSPGLIARKMAAQRDRHLLETTNGPSLPSEAWPPRWRGAGRDALEPHALGARWAQCTRLGRALR